MIQTVVFALLPVFIVVFVGYYSARLDILGQGAGQILGRFVTQVSLPVLIFGALARESLDKIFNSHFVISFGIATLVCFLLPWLLFPSGKVALSIRAMRGLGASLTSASFIAIPVITPLVGSVTLPSIAVSIVIGLVTLGLAIVLLELDQNRGAGVSLAVRRALVHTFKNPIVFGTIGGLAYSFSGLDLPKWVSNTTDLLGAATAPVALFALGMALVGGKFGSLKEVGIISAVKLIVMPLITIGVLLLFPSVDARWAVAAVALAAMSTAVLEYTLAQEFREYVDEASGVVIVSTLVSAVTLPAFIMISLHIWPISS